MRLYPKVVLWVRKSEELYNDIYFSCTQSCFQEVVPKIRDPEVAQSSYPKSRILPEISEYGKEDLYKRVKWFIHQLLITRIQHHQRGFSRNNSGLWRDKIDGKCLHSKTRILLCYHQRKEENQVWQDLSIDTFSLGQQNMTRIYVSYNMTTINLSSNPSISSTPWLSFSGGVRLMRKKWLSHVEHDFTSTQSQEEEENFCPRSPTITELQITSFKLKTVLYYVQLLPSFSTSSASFKLKTSFCPSAKVLQSKHWSSQSSLWIFIVLLCL